ncbi:hypothetical protein EMCRGX_G031786 [Ephydatia muelleri]
MANVPFILCCLCVFLSEASAKLTDDQRATLLQAHNFYRASVSPSAADMQAMRWSDALSELAQQTAEKCDFKTGYNGSQSVGENTLSTPASVTSNYGDLVGSQWFAEFQSYDYPSGGCSTICSHYTELVKSSYDQLGCAAAYCNPVRRLSGALIYNALFLVCKYGFAKENVKGRPYQSGSSCSSCPSNKPICSNRLCDAAAFASNGTRLVLPTPTTASSSPSKVTSTFIAPSFSRSSARVTSTATATAKLSARPASSCGLPSCSVPKVTPTATTSAKPQRPQADVQIFATPTSTAVRVAPSTVKPYATLKTAAQASPKPSMGFVATTLKLGATATSAAVSIAPKPTGAAKSSPRVNMPRAPVTPTPTIGKYSTTMLKATSAPKAAAAVFPRMVSGPSQPQAPLNVHLSGPNPLNAVAPPPPLSPIEVDAPLPNPPLRKSLRTMSLRFGLNKGFKS